MGILLPGLINAQKDLKLLMENMAFGKPNLGTILSNVPLDAEKSNDVKHQTPQVYNFQRMCSTSDITLVSSYHFEDKSGLKWINFFTFPIF